MDFLQRFTDRERERLLAVAQTIRLGRGQVLLRRGDPGGDLYRVEEGEIEVIDSRSQPIIVLQVIGKGALVGEMAFLDDSPRSADVRSSEGATCQRWERRTLLKLLHDEPALGTRFFEMVARILAERIRDLGVVAATGLKTGAVRGSEHAVALGREVGDAARNRFMEVEPLIRRDKSLARVETLTALHNAQEAMLEIERGLSDVDAIEFGSAVARELHPYLMRSQLGELAIGRASGHSGDFQTLEHVLSNRPEGDGPLGEFIDEWLLGLPHLARASGASRLRAASRARRAAAGRAGAHPRAQRRCEPDSRGSSSLYGSPSWRDHLRGQLTGRSRRDRSEDRGAAARPKAEVGEGGPRRRVSGPGEEPLPSSEHHDH